MNALKLTTAFAALSLLAGVAFAQTAPAPASQTPAVQTPADGAANMQGKKGKKGKKGQRGQQAGRQDPNRAGGGPYSKLRAATKLESLEAEQKQKIDAFIEEHKPQEETLRNDMREAIQKARQSTDPQARRAAMQSLRQKSQAIEQEVDTFLAGVLKPEQAKELKEKSAARGRDRMGRMHNNDAATTGAHSRKAGQDGKRWNRQKGAAKQNHPAAANAATTGTQQVNPFSAQ